MKQSVELNGKTILVTGSPGFIGANLVIRLLKEMDSGKIISLDNMNDYYDPALKEYRLRLIEKAAGGGEFEAEFIGLCTDICVVSNALLVKAHFPEMKISVDSACCAGVTPAKHEAALETMRSCQIDII